MERCKPTNNGACAWRGKKSLKPFEKCLPQCVFKKYDLSLSNGNFCVGTLRSWGYRIRGYERIELSVHLKGIAHVTECMISCINVIILHVHYKLGVSATCYAWPPTEILAEQGVVNNQEMTISMCSYLEHYLTSRGAGEGRGRGGGVAWPIHIIFSNTTNHGFHLLIRLP